MRRGEHTLIFGVFKDGYMFGFGGSVVKVAITAQVPWETMMDLLVDTFLLCLYEIFDLMVRMLLYLFEL
jgi:hypothetical protein